ncbi:MAG: stage II sporulation protein R [Oscillospiraceae bacterium]
MKKIILALLIGIVGSCILYSYSSFAQECDQIRNDVFRLHILANSDSKEDQALKLEVRDQILKNSDDIFSVSKNKGEAMAQVAQKKEEIRKIALDEIKKNGYSYDVKVEICNMFFDTRTYEDVTLPAGKYDALRVTIGSASGKNWWCVLYPPLCLQAAKPQEEIKKVLDEKQIDIVKQPQKYEVRFATVEIYEKIKNKLFD